MESIINLFLNSLCIIGFWYVCGKEQLLGPVVNFARDWKISKPVFTCPVCMSSVHGLWFSLTFMELNILGTITWILALAGLITLYVHSGIIKTWLV